MNTKEHIATKPISMTLIIELASLIVSITQNVRAINTKTSDVRWLRVIFPHSGIVV